MRKARELMQGAAIAIVLINLAACRTAMPSSENTVASAHPQAVTLAIATQSLPTGCPGEAYSQAIQIIGGLGPFHFSLASGQLPPPLAIDEVTGIISGKPSAVGSSLFTVAVSDSSVPAQIATQSLNMAISCSALSIIATPLAGARQGQPYSGQMQSAGGEGIVSWSGTGLPAGLEISRDGHITGSPSVAGAFTLSITASDQCNPIQSLTQSFTLNVASATPLKISNTSPLPNGTQGVSYFVQMTASGGTPPYSWTQTGGNFPLEVGPITSDGKITGTPTDIQTTTAVIEVQDSAGHAQSGTFSIEIDRPSGTNPPPAALAISNTSPLPAGTQGYAYVVQMTASGGTPPYSWSQTGGVFPTGFNQITSDGKITGTPTAVQEANAVIQVQDSLGNTQSGSFSIEIDQPFTSDKQLYEARDGGWIGPRYDGPAELPRLGYYTSMDATPSPGAVTTVAAGNFYSLQNAILKANCGDTIVVPSNKGTVQAVYSGPQIAPGQQNCDAAHYITIRTDQIANLPPEGTRISPCYSGVLSLPGRPSYGCPPGGPAILMPKLVGETPGKAVLEFGGSNGFFRVIGLEITVDCTQTSANFFQLVHLGGDNTTHDILDRVWLHGCELPHAPAITGAPLQVQAGATVNGSYMAIIDSYLNNFYTTNAGSSTDSQSFFGGSGDAPQQVVKIVGNFLEAGGECAIFGGGAATVNPTDIEIRRNHCWKPLQWRCDPVAGCPAGPAGPRDHVIVKNGGIELKNSVRVLMEGNVHDYSWLGPSSTGATQGDQNGFILLITPKNQGGKCPLCIVSDVVVRYNRFSHSANGAQIAAGISDTGAPSQGLMRVMVHDNLFDDINNSWAGGACCQFGAGVEFFINAANPRSGWAPHTSFAHNTFIINGATNSSGFLWMVQNSTNPTDTQYLVIQDNLAAAPIFYLNTPGGTLFNGVVAALNTVNPSANWCVQGNLITTGNWSQQKTNSPWPAPVDQPAAGSCPNGKANQIVGTYPTLGFSNYSAGKGGDYRLVNGSTYKGTASDGRDPGADIDALNQYTQGVN